MKFLQKICFVSALAALSASTSHNSKILVAAAKNGNSDNSSRPDFKVKECREKPAQASSGSLNARVCQGALGTGDDLHALFVKPTIEIELDAKQGNRKIKFHYDPNVITHAHQDFGGRSWYGVMIGDDENVLHIIHFKGILSGVFHLDGMVYEIIMDESGELTVIETEEVDLPPHETPDDAIPVPQEAMDEESRRNRALIRTEPPRGLQEKIIVDVLIVYTRNAECKAAGLANGCTLTDTTKAKADAKCALAIEKNNVAYSNSGINAEFRLVHTSRVSYTEQGFSNGLNHLTNKNDGQLEEVHTMRDQYGADIVAMFTAEGGSCGIGWVSRFFAN